MHKKMAAEQFHIGNHSSNPRGSQNSSAGHQTEIPMAGMARLAKNAGRIGSPVLKQPTFD